MPIKDRSFHQALEKAGGEGWLYSEQQQKLCHFKPDTATVHAKWLAIRTYHYVPPRPPEDDSATDAQAQRNRAYDCSTADMPCHQR